MVTDFKDIHIGTFIKKRVEETQVDVLRISGFLKVTEDKIEEMYDCKSLDSEILLRWSKLLEYDFFRLYTQHLILYSPAAGVHHENRKPLIKSSLPEFRKNIYTREIIYFILEMLESGKKTRQQIIEEYNIPKTTLYKWIEKYKTR